MKKILVLLISLVLVVCLISGCQPAQEAAPEEPTEPTAPEEPTEKTPEPEEPAPEVQKKSIGFYMDASDDYYKIMGDTLKALADADPECDWDVNIVVGQSTAAEQLNAVNDFIVSGYDAIIVIQNNADTTSECIDLCKNAGIPYFGAAHDFSSVPNAADAAGSVCYDFVQAGVYAGEDALARGAKKIIMIEGVLGQGSAGAQSLGFIKAYEDAGKDIGGMTAEEFATDKPKGGGADLEIVAWGSGNWFADPAKKLMTDFIVSLGPDGWDGAYVQNDEMMDGAIQAIEEAGLNPSDYWLGASNGKEKSWDWVKNKKTTMDVNQTAALEGDALYQQLKAYFKGEEYRKYIHPYLTPFNIDNINDVALVPFSDVNEYMKQRSEGKFVSDINDPKFIDNPGY
ncbi:MAG: sugar ABC transporter substrate-binding protein [Mahellales bacterium]|jgi:ABC-type sugar transport system substrate-binding protein